MSELRQADFSLRAMLASDIDAVLQIEQQVHTHPWTRGNFSDALASGYACHVAERKAQILGYAILMPGVEDAELLDIGVALALQRQGMGKKILQAMLSLATGLGKQRVVLEVRASNAAAIALYCGAGFTEIGRRRNYYPLRNNEREDAILMGRML